MNIFFLSRDVIEAARFHNNKHCVKMILETAQLLSTAHRILDGKRVDKKWVLEDERESVLYKSSHRNHPSAVWVRSGIEQYRWTHDLLYWLIYEYRFRYGKPHACERLQPYLLNAPHNIPIIDWTDPPQCMPDDCKGQDTVEAYRTYYTKYKNHIAKWEPREIPVWYEKPQKFSK